MAAARAVGSAAETLAANFLKRQGLRILERNFTCRLGEIDIIARDAECLVFVEVRKRRSSGFGSAVLSVDHHKQRKLQRAALVYLRRFPCFANETCRFDVIGIDGNEPGESRLQWIPDAFRPL